MKFPQSICLHSQEKEANLVSSGMNTQTCMQPMTKNGFSKYKVSYLKFCLKISLRWLCSFLSTMFAYFLGCLMRKRSNCSWTFSWPWGSINSCMGFVSRLDITPGPGKPLQVISKSNKQQTRKKTVTTTSTFNKSWKQGRIWKFTHLKAHAIWRKFSNVTHSVCTHIHMITEGDIST